MIERKFTLASNIPIENAFEFAEYCGEYFVKMYGGWMPRYSDQRNIENLLTTEQVYKQYITVWKITAGL